jgi:hypothetical protein
MKKYCVIAAVGKNSLHRKWINRYSKFDLHLIVYDEAFETFKEDTIFITKSKGQKFKLIYDYISGKPDVIDQYEYFYLPDDDIKINTANVHKLFQYMEGYNLAAAQPAISNTYFSHQHTAKQSYSELRFTNFIEIMQPCFSRDALKKVLFTFNASQSGWGIDFHWGKILDYTQMNMAIIDSVASAHTRPVSSNFRQELFEYIRNNNLTTDIYST